MDSLKKKLPFVEQHPSGLVLWDGTCGICTLGYNFINNIDSNNHLQLQTIQDYNNSTQRKDQSKSLDTISFNSIDGTEYIEARAIFEILKTLPGWWGAVGKVFSNRLMVSFFTPIYRLIAQYRHNLSYWLRLNSYYSYFG